MQSSTARKILPIRGHQLAEKLIAVVPAYNESGNIEGLLSELKNYQQSSACESYAFDWIVVDDGSQDDTLSILEKENSPRLSFPFNMGIGIAVQTGFQYAISKKADLVVQIDGDGQHIPLELPKLLEPIQNKEADVVIGTRFISNVREGIQSTTLLRWFAGRLLSAIISFLTGQKLTDTTSGFRVFNARAAKFVASHYPDDYPEVEILVLLSKAGFILKEVPVSMRERKYGKSSINWSRSLYYIFKVIFASIMDKVRK